MKCRSLFTHLHPHHFYFIQFIVILHAPLLWSNTTCIGGLLHNYIISTKIPCSIYKFLKLTIIVYNLSKVILLYFSSTVPPFAARISRVVADGGTWPLKGERLKAGESNGKLPPRTCPGCSVPEPYRSHDWALVPAKPGLQG